MPDQHRTVLNVVDDYVISLIRTMVPVVIGSTLVWTAARMGWIVDDTWSTAATAAVVPLVISAYYAIMRAAELRWPWVGRLLGWKIQPTYRTVR